MNIQQLVKVTVVTGAIGLFNGQVQAHTCGEVSPLKISLGEAYTELSYSTENTSNNAFDDTADLIIRKKRKLERTLNQVPS